jgi:hypothetical protein
VDATILRATGADGEVYDDPSEDLMFMLFEDLETVGSSFIVERVEAEREQEAVRIVLLDADTYAVEGPGEERNTAPIRRAHEALTRWAFDLPDWREPLSRPPDLNE